MQTEPRIRISIFDNASNDSTESVVRELSRHDSRIEYHRNEVNIGLNANYQRAMASVRTPFFSLFADDDELMPSFYQSALSALQANPECGFCGGQTRVQNTKAPSKTWPTQWRAGFHSRDNAITMLTNEHITWTSILFDSKVLKNIGSIDPLSSWYSEHQYEFRVSLQYPIFFVDEVFAIWNDFPYPQRTDFLKSMQGALHTATLVRDLSPHDIASQRIAEWVKREVHFTIKNLMRSSHSQHKTLWHIYQNYDAWEKASLLQKQHLKDIRKQVLISLISNYRPYLKFRQLVKRG
jgi:glycosyltransferase involved in cell wall biosynthesis